MCVLPKINFGHRNLATGEGLVFAPEICGFFLCAVSTALIHLRVLQVWLNYTVKLVNACKESLKF